MNPDQKAYELLREFYHHVRTDLSFLHRGLSTTKEFIQGIESDLEDLQRALEYTYEGAN